ncbi:MAG: peptide deformylase [Nitrospinaceae bacterium]|nr:MAG: peptide deformylase [Nitrospinaceae bacterium]
MAVLDVLVYPDKRLKQISRPVEKFDESLLQFVSDLEETMAAGPPSVGIAAPQVGRFERIVLVDVSCKPKIKNHGRLIMINPEITDKEGSVVGREGCLSVPDYTGNVARSERISVKAYDQFGNHQLYNMEGFEARAVQHEMDHLEGLLFLDRLVSRRDSLFRRKVYKKKSADIDSKRS